MYSANCNHPQRQKQSTVQLNHTPENCFSKFAASTNFPKLFTTRGAVSRKLRTEKQTTDMHNTLKCAFWTKSQRALLNKSRLWRRTCFSQLVGWEDLANLSAGRCAALPQKHGNHLYDDGISRGPCQEKKMTTFVVCFVVLKRLKVTVHM